MSSFSLPFCHQPAWLQPGLWAALVGSSTLVGSLAGVTTALASEVLSSWRFDPIAQQLTLTLPKQITPTYHLSADGRAILLDLPQTRLGSSPTQAEYQGPIRQVRLTQMDDNRVEVRLELDKTIAIRADQIQLLAVAAGDQARWTLTASSQSAPSSTGGMAVSLPTLPADPNLKWPYQGVGRFSIAAANLMLPGNLDRFNQLPQTLALDSLPLGQTENSQVSVPSLEELDRTVGVALTPTEPHSPTDIASLPQRPSQSSPSAGQESQPLVAKVAESAPVGVATPAPASVITPAPQSTTVTVTPTASPLAPITQEPIIPKPSSTRSPAPVLSIPVLAEEPPGLAPSQRLAAAPISFGTPLPDRSPGSSPENRDRSLPPDVLIASGTVLELRYPGPDPLTLHRDLPRNEVLILAREIRDPVTNGVIAPAGSQLVGQFETQPDNSQRWISRLLILPGGERVPFTSSSGYLVGNPQINGNNLALGAGVGAVAATVLGGLSGMGMLGGALLGATTSVGTAPQTLVIEPGQVIHVEVMADIPRSLPIALAPVTAQTWGTQPKW